jgi:hypothetical protein
MKTQLGGLMLLAGFSLTDLGIASRAISGRYKRSRSTIVPVLIADLLGLNV